MIIIQKYEMHQFYQTLIIEGQQRMINNIGEVGFPKPAHPTYRRESDHSLLSRIPQFVPQPSQAPIHTMVPGGMRAGGFKEQVDSLPSNRSSKNIIANLDQNGLNWTNRTILGKTNYSENLTNSCYLASQRTPLGTSAWENRTYRTQEPNLPGRQKPTDNEYYQQPKLAKRHSHYTSTTTPLYWSPEYSEYTSRTRRPSAYLTALQASYHNELPKNQYSAFELGGSKHDILTKNHKCKTLLEKTKNNNHQFNEDDTYKTNNLTNNTESSVVPVSGRTDMAESPSGAKFKQLCETSNSELRTSHKGKQTPASPKLEKTRSWLETPREPRLDDFTIGQCKGEGRFGKVYMATHKKTGFLCALKKVKKQSVKYMIDQFIQEMKIQLFLNHPKLVKLYGYFSDIEHIYMLIEYMEDGSLYSLMKRVKQIKEAQAIEKLNQICQGVKEMHDNNIVHRDLKPQNVVMSHGVCKVCDFGWAAICEDRRLTYCGTLDYVCPEIVEGNSYNSGVDVWCIGVLAYEMMCGKAPFYDISRRRTIQKIKTCKIQSFPAHLSKQAIRFIEMILTKDPNNRTGIQELLNSQFLISNQQGQTN